MKINEGRRSHVICYNVNDISEGIIANSEVIWMEMIVVWPLKIKQREKQN